MLDVLIPAADAAVPIRALAREAFAGLAGFERAVAESAGFKGEAGQLVLVPGSDGRLARVLFGLGAGTDPMVWRGLPSRLPAGDYRLETAPDRPQAAALAWALGTYVFDRYKKREDKGRARLVVPDGADGEEALRVAAACFLAREMVDTPAADMGPLQIETIAREIAEAHGASLTVVRGDDLLEQNYPAVHAVGRAADPRRAPRMIELLWRADRTDLPLVALVGKGVVFDSGGLNIKGGGPMRNMKKDMGGAAHVLALGRLVMQADLPVRLAVLVPAVENAISGDAFRPGDVLQTRQGLTVEIGNTDAEGRLILADALTRAGELEPELTLDYATLTGAARIALGPELPPLYTADEALAADFAEAAAAESDPLWRMPLWDGYADALNSDVADLRNDPAEWAQAGSVTAALFLRKFAPRSGAWAHFDVFAWNPKASPGRPAGGEAQALRAAYAVLRKRYG